MSLRFALPSLSSFGARLAARLAGTVALLKSGQFDMARLKVSNDVENAFGPLKSDFSNLFALALAAGDSQAALQHVANRRGLYALILLVLAALGLTLWVDLRIIRSLTGCLAVAARVATRITQGSLGGPVEPGHGDEIGRLLRSLDGMDRRLAAVVGQGRDRACMLDSNAAGIADGNDALSRRTELQAMQLRVPPVPWPASRRLFPRAHVWAGTPIAQRATHASNPDMVVLRSAKPSVRWKPSAAPAAAWATCWI